jgi:hypothetical protein
MTSGTPDTRTADAPTPRPGVTSVPGQQPVTSLPRGRLRALPAPVVWGVIQAVSPLGFGGWTRPGSSG